MSVEEESLVKHKGRVGHLAVFSMFAVCVAAGGSYLMKQLDAREAIVSAAAGVQRIRSEQLDPFLRCALPGLDRAQLNSKERLIGAIDDYSETLGKDYARTLARCLPVLEEIAPALAAQSVPKALGTEKRALHDSVATLTRAVQSYRAHLSAPGKPYDYLQSLPLIEKIAVAWEGYEVSASEFDTAVRAKLD